jgi:hypothetical protein
MLGDMNLDHEQEVLVIWHTYPPWTCGSIVTHVYHCILIWVFGVYYNVSQDAKREQERTKAAETASPSLGICHAVSNNHRLQ